MAELTSTSVCGDFYRLLRKSDLAKDLTGTVYLEADQRPRDSQLEDAVIIFTSGLSEQIQTGVVTINIFVPDRNNGIDGTLEKDAQRCKEIEQAAARWRKSLTAEKTCYKFPRNQQTIYTEADTELHQHFVVVKLKYGYYDGED